MCAVLTTLALIYEGLHVLKIFFLNRFIVARKAHRRESNDSGPGTSSGSHPSSSSSRPFLHKRGPHANENGSGEPAPRSLLEESDNHAGHDTIVRLKSSSWDFLELGISSALHSIYVFLGFTLMNAVMTFNCWLLIAISIGVALGYFCFGNYRKEENLMHPLGTGTTSLNGDHSSSSTPPPPIIDGGGDRCVGVPSKSNQSPSRTPVLNHSSRNEEYEDPGESSRLIVGAEVHTPRILSTSTTST